MLQGVCEDDPGERETAFGRIQISFSTCERTSAPVTGSRGLVKRGSLFIGFMDPLKRSSGLDTAHMSLFVVPV